MQLQEIFTMQKALDKHIEMMHQLTEVDLFNRKVLALLVEIGELANETRCFKFWSLKTSSPQSVILEEFVDGIHFLLSLGLECGFEEIEEISAIQNEERTMSDLFLHMYGLVNTFRITRSHEDYVTMFSCYLTLANLLGFDDDEIKEAYIAKNEVNYKRQQEGY